AEVLAAVRKTSISNLVDTLLKSTWLRKKRSRKDNKFIAPVSDRTGQPEKKIVESNETKKTANRRIEKLLYNKYLSIFLILNVIKINNGSIK
ncbi:MAG: hypothetical protein ACKO96_40950, partial [Flammeovirgaceae bacterium]